MAYYLSHKILPWNLLHRDIDKSNICNSGRKFLRFDMARTNKETKIRKETCFYKPGMFEQNFDKWSRTALQERH